MTDADFDIWRLRSVTRDLLHEARNNPEEIASNGAAIAECLQQLGAMLSNLNKKAA